MNYLDLFSGCGGFRLGLQKAGIIPEHEFHSEIDKYADQVYCKHYSKSGNLGDINNVKTDGTVRGHKINLVTFGFPCQDLSVAGKGEGLEGARSGLFYEATRLIKELKPDVFIFENVKGLLTSKRGADFKSVLQEIADMRIYDCQWQLINTRWVLPQNRERIFFIGCLAGSGRSRQQIFPFTEADRFCNAREREKIQQGNEASCLTARQYASWRGNHVLEQINIKKSQAERVYKYDGLSSSLNALGGGGGAKTGLYAIPIMNKCIMHNGHKNKNAKIYDVSPTLKAESHGHQPMTAIPVLTPDRLKKRQNGRRFKDNGDPSFTLTSQDKHGIYNGHNIRRLTPIECERLQGFPDNWTNGVSDTQRYKMLGNAVTADITEMIFRNIYNL